MERCSDSAGAGTVVARGATGLATTRRRACACPIATSVPGTFGELAQGYRLGDDGHLDHFLFTLPVRELSSTAQSRSPSGGFRTWLGPKARRALHEVSAHLGIVVAPEDEIQLSSNIPVGKGCGSSTADIVAIASSALRTFAPGLGLAESKAIVEDVVRKIEFGDYLMHSGISACDQQRFELLRAFDTDLRWRIVGVDEGGVVDTAKFHRDEAVSMDKAQIYEELVSDLYLALESGSSHAVGALATRSALLHQDTLPKRSLEPLLEIGEQTGAHGICIAHSGTVLGLIYSEHEHDSRHLAQALELVGRRLETEPRLLSLLETSSCQDGR